MRGILLAAGFALLLAGVWAAAVVANFTPRPTTGYSRDLYAYFFPRFAYGSETVWAGRIPLWNPHELCGAPFLASAQSGVLNPLTVLIFGLVPATAALHAYFLAHLFLAGIAMYLFCRALGITWQGASLGAVAWALSPALLRSIYNPNRIACLVWLPAIFWLGDRLGRRASLRDAALLALALAAEACAGYPEFVLDTGVLLGVFVLTGLVMRREGLPAGRVIGLLAGTGGLAVLLAGAQLAPTVELLRESARAALTGRATLAPGPGVLATIFGLPRDAGFAYLGMLPALYVGALPLVLAARAPARDGVAGSLLACALACVFAVVGYRWLHLLPIYRLTRFALPWALLLPFFTAVLAGVGWDAAVARPAGRTALVVLALLVAGFLGLGTPAGMASGLAAVALVALAARFGPRLYPLAILLLVIDLVAALPYFRGTDPFPPLPRSDTTRALLDEVRPRGVSVRFLGVREAYTDVALGERALAVTGLEDSAMPRRLRRIVDHFNLAIAADMPLRLDRVGTSRPLLDLMGVAYVTGPPGWADGLARAGFVALRTPTDSEHGLWQNPAALPRAFLVRDTVLAAGEDAAFSAVTSPAFRPAEQVVLEERLGDAVEPGSLLPGEEARLVRDAGEEVRVETALTRPGILVLADTYFPGWEATVDGVGTPILRADYAFRAVRVPAGRHTVGFSYRPRSFRVGVFASVLGLAIAAVALAPRAAVVRVMIPRGGVP